MLAAATLSGRDLHWLAWFAWVPLLLAVRSGRIREAALAGGVAGMVQAAILLHWVPSTTAFMGKGAAVGGAVAMALGGLWAAAMALLCVVIRLVWGASQRGGPAALRAAVLVPAVWVIYEFTVTRALCDVPWLFYQVGYSQWGNRLLLQLAAVTGVFGISFVVISVNAALADVLRARLAGASVVASVGVAAALLYGWSAPEDEAGGAPLRVAVLQGNVPAWSKLDETKGNRLAQQYLALAREANVARAQLVVWTESAIPWPLTDGDALVEHALQATRDAQATHLVGAPIAHPAGDGTYYNAVVLVQADGRVTGQYAKNRPLVAAETPVALPGVARPFKLHPTQADYVAATTLSVLRSPGGVLGVSICNENLYAALVRAQVRMGAGILVNVSNDGWFRSDMPLRQHLAVNVFRAVENRRPIVVANNSGLSALIDRHGRIQSRTAMGTAQCLAGTVRPCLTQTLYTLCGDAFAGLCAITIAGSVIAAPLTNHRKQDEEGGKTP